MILLFFEGGSSPSTGETWTDVTTTTTAESWSAITTSSTAETWVEVDDGD